MLGIVFIAIGRLRWTALATTAICIVGHLAIAVPIMLGWITRRRRPDRAPAGERVQLVDRRDADRRLPRRGLRARPLGAHAPRRPRSPSCRARCGSSATSEQALAEVVDEAAAPEARQRGPLDRPAARQLPARPRARPRRDGRGLRGGRPRRRSRPRSSCSTRARRTSSAIVERFHREMDVAARLESPHIVKVFEVSPPDAPVPYIAMERLHGTDLATRLRSENRHAVRRAGRAARSGRARPRGRAARRRRASRSQAAQPVPARRRDLEDPRLRRRRRCSTARAR